VGVVHVHVVHPILAAHSTQGIEGASETSKQERAMSQNCREKKDEQKNGKYVLFCFLSFYVLLLWKERKKKQGG
jgi:hypothetical protein